MTNAASADALLELDSRFEKLASEDLKTLATLITDDFMYNHSTGRTENKTEWLAGLEKLIGKRQRVSSNHQVELHGDVGVAFGDLDIVWSDRVAKDRYVRVYRMGPSGWQAISQRTVKAHDRAEEAH